MITLIITYIIIIFFIGRIVNIVSILGRIATPLRSPYCTVKFGVEAFSDCLRLEMRRWGVDVVVVEPGDYTTGEQNIYVIHVLIYIEDPGKSNY
jgi:NAD(P)-dependent dehydrogenase (short-subunit alcohol dehydrogenase family)